MQKYNYKLSIIVPVYNVEKYLEDTIQSLIEQTIFNELEVVLVNDGSKDNSPLICEKYAKIHGNIKFISQENAGVSEARNTGLQSATGQYISFLDADDLIEKDLYEKMWCLAVNTDAQISIVDFDMVYSDGSRKKHRGSYSIEWNGNENILKAFFAGGMGNNVVDKIFSAEFIKELKFPKGYKVGEDMFFVYETIRHADKVVIDTNICGYHYMIRDNSAMTGAFSEKYFDTIKLSEMMVKDCENINIIKEYAEAHLIHETCKVVEYIYKHNAINEYKTETVELLKKIHGYKITKAKTYLVRKQFYGFLLMRISPRLYMFVHKLMKIG